MMSRCHNCIFDSYELSDWYGCIFGNGLLEDCCEAWIPNDAATAEMKRNRRNWRKIYTERKKHNAQVPEEQRICVDKNGEVVRIPMLGGKFREIGN